MRVPLALARHLLIVSCFILAACSVARCQTDPLQARNPIPWGSYEDSQVDAVNLMNGSLILHMPVYSLPQRGQLSLTFSLKGTSPAYGFGTYTCTANHGLGPCYTGGFTWNNKLTLVLDQALFATVKQYRFPANSNTFYNVYSITDSSGSIHELGYDNANRQLLRTTDGTGFLYNPTLTPPYTPYLTDWGLGTIYTPSGIQHIVGNSSYSIRDSDGNSIAMATGITSNWGGITQITDSLARTIPPLPTQAASSSTTGCPTVTALYQATTGSSTWIVPGPNGAQLTFLFCYTSIYSHTDFFGGCINTNNNCIGNYDGAGTDTNILQSIVLPNGTYYQFTYGAANPSDSSSYGYADLTQIHLPSGGTINYQYANLPSTCTTASGCANHGGGVNAARGVSNRVFDPGSGGQQASWTYAYTDYNSNTATVTDLQGNDTVFTFSYLGGLSGSPSCSNGNFSPSPYETKQQVYKGSHTSGAILLTKNTSYQITCGNPQGGTWRGSSSIIAALPTQVQTTLDNGLVTTTTHQYNDGGYVDVQPACTAGANNSFSCTWSATQQVPFGLETSTTVTDYGGATLRTVNTQYLFQQNSSYYPENFLNQVASTTTLNGSGTQVAKATFAYDENNGSPQGFFAHQTSVNRWLNTTNNNITSKAVYNTQGMVTQSIDPLLNTTTYTYDSTGAFLSQVQYPTTSGVTHIEHFTLDPNTGLTTSYTDQNGKVTSTQYDLMRRITQITYPDSGQTTYCYTDMGGSTCAQSGPPFQLVTTQLATPDPSVIRTTAFDGLGRITQRQLSDPDCASGDKTDTTYDGLARVYTVSNPYCSTTDATYGVTTYRYDALGRTCLVVPPDAPVPSGNTCPSTQPSDTVFSTYSGNTTTVTDEAGKKRQSTTDGLGRLTQVVEDPGGLGYVTSYGYDALDNLTSVVQNGSRQRTFTYDSLSRLTQATNPESGTITYAYDGNGNALTKTAPAPNQTGSATVTLSYCYDALNRMTAKAYTYSPNAPPTCSGTPPTFPSPAATYAYDAIHSSGPIQGANDVGRLATTWSPLNSTGSIYNYDSMGRHANTLDCIDVNCNFNSINTYTYDLAGDMTVDANKIVAWNGPPINSLTLSQVFDSAGRVTQLTSSWVDSQHPSPLATVDSSVGYWPTRALRKVKLGNALYETAAYNKRLQPCRMNVNSTGGYFTQCNDSVPSGNVQDFNFGFNLGSSDNGNVASWSASGNQNFSRSYSYDSLNRLQSMSAPGDSCSGLSWSYDAWGNRTAQTTTGGSCYQEPSTTFSTKNQFPPSYQYDAAGNMTNDGIHSYTYDAENRLTQVDGGSTASYGYDPLGRRVLKTISGTTTSYVYDLSGNVLLDTQGSSYGTIYLYFAGQLQAQYKNSTTSFIHGDHIGSTRLVTGLTNPTSPIDNLDYLPFGEQIAGDTSTTHKFTGKERDSESGLDNFGARYNSSSLGRFMTPDPLMASATVSDPQTWNRYSYALNNPLHFTDPDGMKEVTAQECKKDANCVSIKLNVVYDKNANNGKGLTDQQKKDFDKQLQNVKDEYGDADIHFDVSYTTGGADNNGIIQGLSRDSLNVLVTDSLPTTDSGVSQYSDGYFLSGVNITSKDTGTLSDEIAHQLTGDRTGITGAISQLGDNIFLAIFNRVVNAAFDINNGIQRAQLDPNHGGPAPASQRPCTRCNVFNSGARDVSRMLSQNAIRPRQ